jgi:hypothetical protein
MCNNLGTNTGRWDPVTPEPNLPRENACRFCYPGQRRPKKRIQKKLLKRRVRLQEGFKRLGEAFAQDVDYEMHQRPCFATLILGTEEARLAEFNRTHSWTRFRF